MTQLIIGPNVNGIDNLMRGDAAESKGKSPLLEWDKTEFESGKLSATILCVKNTQSCWAITTHYDTRHFIKSRNLLRRKQRMQIFCFCICKIFMGFRPWQSPCLSWRARVNAHAHGRKKS
jgi:hypothetical protein